MTEKLLTGTLSLNTTNQNLSKPQTDLHTAVFKSIPGNFEKTDICYIQKVIVLMSDPKSLSGTTLE